MMYFTEDSIRKLFGHEAAEDEDIYRLKRYYLKREMYNAFKSDIPLFILVGHKGVGKSALFAVLKQEDLADSNIALSIKPDDILELQGDEQFLKKIKIWKSGLTRIILKELNRELIGLYKEGSGNQQTNKWIDSLKELLMSTCNKRILDISEDYADLSADQIIHIFKNALFKEKKVTVYLDDLDRGWKNTRDDIENISAMMNAIRDISRDIPNVFFRIALRSDVYYSVRTSDETTDKIDGSVRWLTWTNHEILVMLIKRLETFFQREVDEYELLRSSQAELQKYLNQVFTERFEGAGHWSNAPMYRVLMSLIRKRPRDLVKLCTLAALKAQANNHDKIMTSDMEACFNSYSQDRLVDTINEYQSEFPKIESLLLQMRPTKKEMESGHVNKYTRPELITKLKRIQSTNSFLKPNGSPYTANDLAAFLYKINFLTARKIEGECIKRLYYEESRYVYNEFADFGADFEVHPAYRWALQPLSTEKIFRQIDLEMES